jgi:hypothetical protein
VDDFLRNEYELVANTDLPETLTLEQKKTRLKFHSVSEFYFFLNRSIELLDDKLIPWVLFRFPALPVLIFAVECGPAGRPAVGGFFTPTVKTVEPK